ncbi:hypothetical protein Cgig2_032388 [Carnegiea gigantea]|uniref:Uncharacterized protein n=1 Tax=Carnegiea gigantea TaxID=171969 RepID=A0A9Q1GR09_9CARY|nr:hypothetical protein Cgig2_032388 [Carnegiea gigantea]
MDDIYLFALPPDREVAKLNTRSTTLNELNSVVHEVSNATIVYHRGCTSSIPPMTCQEVRIYIWNYRGLARASFRPNLFTMMSITGAYVVVLTDTRVGSRNARRLLDEAHNLKYNYSSKVEVSGFIGHDTDMSCIVRVRTPVKHLTRGLELCEPHFGEVSTS